MSKPCGGIRETVKRGLTEPKDALRQLEIPDRAYATQPIVKWLKRRIDAGLTAAKAEELWEKKGKK